MTPERYELIGNLYHQALQLPAERRAAFIQNACEGDDEMRRELESLLAAHDEASGFMAAPAIEGAAATLANPGGTIGPYRLGALLGRGGMGDVYQAHDSRLGRDVAIKILPAVFKTDPERLARFEREARAAAALNHPHICTIYDVGPDYLVMERLEGETLAERLARGPLPVNLALEYGSEIAGALAAAHAKGLVHRDLTPANVMVTPSGTKVLDFGLAKQIAHADGDASVVTFAPAEAPAAPPESATRPGQILGTTAYMSPEQAEGKPVDTRSDVFSFGVVLYEMLGGRRPFSGDTALSTLASILKTTPDGLRSLRPGIPEHVERVVNRCLEKDPAARYVSATDVDRELARYRAAGPRPRAMRITALAAGIALAAVVGTLGVRAYMNAARARWVEQTAVPEITRLLASDRPFAALKVYRDAEAADPSARALLSFHESLNTPKVRITTTPPGAEVYVSDYVDGRDGDRGWALLGTSPVTTDRIPYWGYYRMRVSKAGFATIERPLDPFTLALTPGGARVDLVLRSADRVPANMVWVDSIAAGVPLGLGLRTPAAVPAFLLDKYEVTNREFKAFVDAGGYQSRTNWKERFVDNGRELSWEDATARFRDATSRSGPATWQLGTFPEGAADFPVSGVSWYEAAAYCRFAGKNLPTAYHWYQAAGVGMISSMLQSSNFLGKGPQPVGRSAGLSQYGALDMAGNVNEWSASPVGQKMAILGGGWNESTYTFAQLDARQPFERSDTFGFRCARFIEDPPPAVSGPVTPLVFDRRGEKPVSDDVYRVYAALHHYDRTDLAAKTEFVDDSKPYLHRETVTFRAAYGGERVVAHLFLPRNATPPYQAVLFVPSGNMFFFRSIDTLPDPFEFLVRAGRAVLVVAVKGTLERGPSPFTVGPNEMRDRLLQWSKDVQRSIDYLETRPEIDAGKLAFYGISYSAGVSPTLLAPEPRFKAAVLVSGGVWSPAPAAEADPLNYAPRVQTPVLMLNGRDDLIFPVETAQIPLFRALGTPEQNKRHMLFDGGHVNLRFRNDLIGEILKWLDQYLGPVSATS